MAGPGKPKTGGRRPGVANKSTREAREAIAAFVDGNAHRLQDWLDRVANGVPKRNEAGVEILDDDGCVKYDVKPDPEKAFDLFQKVIEYHVPKLNRTEVTGPEGGPVQQAVSINVNFVRSGGKGAE